MSCTFYCLPSSDTPNANNQLITSPRSVKVGVLDQANALDGGYSRTSVSFHRTWTRLGLVRNGDLYQIRSSKQIRKFCWLYYSERYLLSQHRLPHTGPLWPPIFGSRFVLWRLRLNRSTVYALGLVAVWIHTMHNLIHLNRSWLRGI